jgi:Protein of unknown function (DUF3172)
MGMGAGVWFNSEASFRPNNVASTEMIDRKTPNSELCMANGYSSMVFDQRIFVSFNPCAPTTPWSRLLLKIDIKTLQTVARACNRVQAIAMDLPHLCRQCDNSCSCCNSDQTADIMPCLSRFNVYVAQPEVKPGCVLRRSNVRELESRNLVDSKEVSMDPDSRACSPAYMQTLYP